MSHIIATLHAYDCMDQVQISLTCRDIDEDVHEGAEPLQVTTTAQGEGVTDLREWLRDCLLVAIEAL